MGKRQLLVGFGGGLIAGLAVGAGWLGGRALPRAEAQPGRAEPPRFELKTWAYPGTAQGNGGVIPGSHGAYILDTATGKLWQSKDGGQIATLGQAQ